MTDKQHIKVYFRVFPEETMIWDYVKILNDQKTIYIRTLQELSRKEIVLPTFWTFHTDGVYFHQSQSEIYEEIGPEVIDSVLSGQDAILTAYGQTGTGKSLTMNGIYSTYENRGFLLRLAANVLDQLYKNAGKNIKKRVQISYAEFSRTTINDLLKSYPNQVAHQRNISKTKIKTLEDIYRIVFEGEGRKTFTNHEKYSHSCTSVFTFYINTKNTEMQARTVHQSKLHIIDFAGVDTVGNVSCSWKKARDVGSANLAKTQLEQFFLILASDLPEQIKIKQRLNPLIGYLGDCLSKQTILRFIGHIRTSKPDLLITISMLRFGELIGGIRMNKYQMANLYKVNENRATDLQQELTGKLQDKYKFLMDQDLPVISEERFAHIERTVREYLENKINKVALYNVCDINLALEMLKMICNEQEEKKETSNSSLTKSKKSLSRLSVQKKSSRVASKASLSDQKQKASDGKSIRSRSFSGSVKTSKLSLSDAGRVKSKQSSTSLLKRSSQSSRKKSGTSLDRTKSKSKEEVLMPQFLPEFSEAWQLYLEEKHEEYLNTVECYDTNETKAKEIYRNYLDELAKLREMESSCESLKHDLFLIKMTREFQNNEPSLLKHHEACCLKRLEEMMREKVEKKENILMLQAELKTYISLCKEYKTKVSQDFQTFCQEKFQAPVPNLMDIKESSEMSILDDLNEQKEVPDVPQEEPEIKMFDRFKRLIEVEQKKRKLYLMKHQEWTTYH